MWLVKFAILVLVLACAVVGEDKCIYSLDIKHDSGHKRRSPQISLVNLPNTECSYRIKAPFGHRIRVSCEFSQKRRPHTCNDDDGVYISTSGGEDLVNTTFVNCNEGKILKESEGEILFLHMRSPSEERNGNFICTLSLIQPICICRGKNENSERIVNGIQAARNEFPMMAALFKLSSSKPFCGATIKYYAVTAAHCIYDVYDNVMLYVGGHDLDDASNPYTRVYRLNMLVPHPFYTEPPFTNDVGLVRTAHPIQFNQIIGPVCLPWKFRESTFTNKSVEASGWGRGTASRVLQKVNLDVIDNANCSTYWRKSQITSGQLCTYTPNKDTCQGDSRGPLFYTEPESERLYLVGIVSYGDGCATKTPAVNTRVTEYLDWIASQTRDTSLCYA